MSDFCALSVEQFNQWFIENQEQKFHAKQVIDWVYHRAVLDWDVMTNLSKQLRSKLRAAFSLGTLRLRTIQDSKDEETYKFLWQLQDDKLVESVLICSGDRRTLCVSSQVGCPARCAFCASGKEGLFRNLTVSEIIEQFLGVNHWLMQKGEKLTHVVYMGMGEPFDNYEAVVQSIRVLTDPDLINLSQRRVTVSTVGVVEGIQRFSQEGVKVNLVLSLHAPNQHIRQKIIPYARKYPLDQILLAMDQYAKATKRDVTYEYILLSGINDQPEHAQELAKLIGSRQCTVNLIPYNPVSGLRLKKPTKEAITAFRQELDRKGIINTCRYTKGDDIAAACGQLALQHLPSQGSGLSIVST